MWATERKYSQKYSASKKSGRRENSDFDVTLHDECGQTLGSNQRTNAYLFKLVFFMRIANGTSFGGYFVNEFSYVRPHNTHICIDRTAPILGCFELAIWLLLLATPLMLMMWCVYFQPHFDELAFTNQSFTTQYIVRASHFYRWTNHVRREQQRNNKSQPTRQQIIFVIFAIFRSRSAWNQEFDGNIKSVGP